MRSINRVFLTAALAVAPVAMADVQDQIDFRQGYWQVVKHEFGDVMAAMLRDKRPMDAARFAEAADRLAVLAPLASDAFPEGSMGEGSRALASIWEDPEGFAGALAAFEAKALALQTAVQAGDQATIGQAFKDMGATCKSCHNDYRAE